MSRSLGNHILLVVLVTTTIQNTSVQAEDKGITSNVSAERTVGTTRQRQLLTGEGAPRLAVFDRLMIEFVGKNDVPGASLAITKDGRLIYARGFGYADLRSRKRVQPTSLFRIASISKSITAVAILQLVEKGKLRLEDPVFNILKLRPHPLAAIPDRRLYKVSILHLLQHRGGWDAKKSFEPMFHWRRVAQSFKVQPPAGQTQIIRYMMGRPLDFDPGERSAYSNFGYCILGRVVEKVTGQSYEAYVQEHVLHPIGIVRMRQGKTALTERAPNEVKYYDPENRTGRAVVGPQKGRIVPTNYGTWPLENLDSGGGWIASAVELAKFACVFDDPERCPILSKKSITTMFARPVGLAGYEANGNGKLVYFGCGWSVRPVGNQGKLNTWKGGYFPRCSSSRLVRRADGINWVVLFNSGEDQKGKVLDAQIDGPLHRAADSVKVWPSQVNLFSTFMPSP